MEDITIEELAKQDSREAFPDKMTQEEINNQNKLVSKAAQAYDFWTEDELESFLK